MKKIKYAFGLTLISLLLILSSCGGSTAGSGTGETGAAPTDTVSSAETTESESGASAEAAAEVTITDLAGRSVTVPADIGRVCTTGQPGAVMLYTLCPDKLAAWNSELSAGSLTYINEACVALPVIGSMQGGNTTASREEVAALNPDVIVYMTTLDANTAATADSIQESMNIPVVTVGFDLETIGESYRFLGELLNCTDRADELGAYCDNIISDVKEKSASIAENDKVTFYYTSGGKGLQTSPGGSSHTEIIELAGGLNVVSLPAESNGRLKVNMEQVLAWNPDVIITAPSENGGNVSAMITGDSTWGTLDAVKNGKVYSAPAEPFSWLDAPVSVNRIIGICWIAETIYPDVYEYDLNQCAKDFYSLFYSCDLTDKQISSLLIN